MLLEGLFNQFVLTIIRKSQVVYKATTKCDIGKFARSADVLSLNWLPIKEEREWNVLKLSYKALHDENWPSYQNYYNWFNILEFWDQAKALSFKSL
jgi:hypothetical protein